MLKKMMATCLMGVCLLLSGCATEEAIPRYPGARYMNSEQISSKVDKPDYFLTVAGYDTPDYIDQVGEFYNAQLGTKTGWTGTYQKGMEVCFWSDGNIEAIGNTLSSYKPKDPKKPGGQVAIFKKEGGCMIQIVTSTPK